MRSAVPLGLATLGIQPLGLGMTRGVGGAIPTVMILPPPAFASGRTLIWKQSPPIRVYSDGTKWWDTSVTPSVEIVAWWAPARCKLHVDFENSRFYWNGTVRALSDLTAVTGGYTLTDSLGVSTAFTSQVEYRYDHTATVSGVLLSWSNTGSNRAELTAQNIDTNRKLTRFFIPKATTSSDFITYSYGSKADEGGSQDGRGRQRIVMRAANGGRLDVRTGPSEIHSRTHGDGANVRVFAPTKFAFSVRAFDNGTPLTNGSLFFATIWSETLSDDEMFEVQAPINVPFIHLLGDSFLNLYKTYDQVRLGLEANEDRYYAISQDGVGGSSLQEQAARFITEFTPWHKATLVIADGGRDYGSSDPGTVAGRNAFNQAGVDSMLATITHDRWLLLGSAPNTNAGTGSRNEWDQSEDFLATYAGGNWVDTLTPMQARSNGGADDINYVTNLDLWPLSQRVSSVDFHPSAAGFVGYGLIAADALIAKGWDVVPNIGA